MTGAALGPIFSTCSSTYFIVLASVLPVRPVLGFVYLVAYSCGLALALLIVTFAGQKILKKLNLVADAYGMLKKSISVLFIIIGFLIITGIDKKIEAQILQLGYFDVTKIEHAVLKFRGM